MIDILNKVEFVSVVARWTRTEEINEVQATLNIACSWGYEAKLITCDTIMHRSAEILGIDNIFLEL